MIARQLLRTTLAAVSAAGILAACAGDVGTVAPLAPTSASQFAGLGRVKARPNGNAQHGFADTKCDTHNTFTGSGVFGPSGGTLIFGTSRLIIPGGALQDTVTITATVPEGDNERVVFQPHGLQFAKSAGLLLDTSGCSIDPLAVPDVVYLSELGEVLEIISAVYDPRLRTFAAPIDHFSGYAIAF